MSASNTISVGVPVDGRIHASTSRGEQVQPRLMNTSSILPISKDELAEAKAMLAAGKSLAQAADSLGCTTGELDLALWEDGGKTGPAPYARGLSKVPRFAG